MNERVSGAVVDAPFFLLGGGETGALMRGHDWSISPLGDPFTWSQSLRTVVGIMLGSRQPMLVVWGAERITLYNDGYAVMCGDRHPAALGRPFAELWFDIWDAVEPILERAYAGEGTSMDDIEFTMFRHGYPEETHFAFSYTPVRDEMGQVAGMFCACTETTAQFVGDRALRQSQEGLQLALSAGRGIGIWDWDVPHDRVTADEQFARMYGVDPGKAAAGAPIVEFFGAVHPDDLPQLQQAIADALRTGEVFFAEYRLMQPDGTVRCAAAEGRCTLAPDGTPLRFPGVTFDITDRKASEAALRDSEARLRLALKAGKLGFWSLEIATMDLSASDGCKANFGRPFDEPFTYAQLRDAIHPDDRDRMETSVALSLSTGEDYDIDYRVLWPDGSFRWIQVRGQPEFDQDGTPIRMAGITLDVTGRKHDEQHLRLLVNELNHRVKNSLSTVQAIAAQTFRNPDSFDQAKREFTTRIVALAKAHDVLTQANWTGASLREIVERTVDPHRSDVEDRFRIDGPHLVLPPKSALALSMALHELCTNAAKYGALSDGNGRVSIAWSVGGEPVEPRLRMRWQETGGPAVVEPTRKGFGSRLIEYGLSAELGGEVRICYEPQGVLCIVDAPLPPA